jgi:hypothetical protein
MRSLVTVLVLLSATATWGADAKVATTGKVVAVEDDDSLWVYVPSVVASYHVKLTGVGAPSQDQSSRQSVHHSLAKLVLGRDVLLSVDRLNAVGLTNGEVFLEGRSVNAQLAAMVAGPPVAKSDSPAAVPPARRPLVAALGTLFRSRLPPHN